MSLAARAEALTVVLGEKFYRVERPWGRLPHGDVFGPVSQLAVDSSDKVYVFQRADPPVQVFNPDGGYALGWGGDIVCDAHGISISRDDRVFLVDRDAHQIIVCDRHGSVTDRLGNRHNPALGAPFNHPTDVAVAADGDIYVSDGYGNSLVHWFSPDLELKRSWGGPGTGPGEFSTPHGIWVDQSDRVLVTDRENNRVQVFDREGRYLEQWGDLDHHGHL